jgi:acyl-coenzyme A synthetase/AMP-(fatty) acid ligase
MLLTDGVTGICSQDRIPAFEKEAPVEWVDAEDPSFMLYTSGSTGKPKVSLGLRPAFLEAEAASTNGPVGKST